MKFLCENCKAKYQISDEKVAGRTVRMKCRKCGHLIEVEASVTETSVATKPPTPSSAPAAGPSAEATPHADAPAGSPAPGPVYRSTVPPPPRGRGAVPTPSPRKAPDGATFGAKPPAPPARPDKAAGGGEREGATPGGAGLSHAFAKAVAAPLKGEPSTISAAIEVLSSASSEEWYVGINGVPVGPVRLSELRRKAAVGAVTEDSLCWREGFEEWVPLRTFPELAAIVHEAATSGRASLTPAPAPVGSWSGAPPAVGGRPPARTPPPRPPAPGPPPRANVNNVVPITSRLATAEKLEVAPVIINDNVPDAEPSASAALAPAVGLPLASTSADTSPSISALGVRAQRKRRVHPAAWVAMGLVGTLFGLMGGIWVATRKPAPVQIVTVTVPAANAPTASAAAPGQADTDNGVTTIGPIEVAAAPGAKTGGGSGAAPKPVDKPATGGTPAPVNTSLSGLSGLVGGPTAGGGPSGGGAQGSSGGALATADVERVVQSHRAFVKRQCWEPALSAKPANAPSSARVLASITIAGDGHVSSANTSGGDAYPGLASCVQGQVRNWRFPASDGATVSVPFVFAAQ